MIRAKNITSRTTLSRIEQADSITYPPEMLPFPDEDEGGDVFVCMDHQSEGECLNCRFLAAHPPELTH